MKIGKCIKTSKLNSVVIRMLDIWIAINEKKWKKCWVKKYNSYRKHSIELSTLIQNDSDIILFVLKS